MAQINFGMLDTGFAERIPRNMLAMQQARETMDMNRLNTQNQQEDRAMRNALLQDRVGVERQQVGLQLMPQIAQLLHADPSDQNVDALAAAYSQATGKDVSAFAQQLKQLQPQERQQFALRLGQKSDPNFRIIQHGGTAMSIAADPVTGKLLQGGSITMPESELDRERAAYYKAQAGRRDRGNAPSGYQFTDDGKLTFIEGGPADPNSDANKVKKGDDQGGKVLPATRLEDLADMKRMRDELVGVGDELAKTPVSTGPIAGRAQSIAAKVGIADDSFVNLQQRLASVENIMLKLRSGAAVTDQEYERFKREYPNVNDTEEVRNRKLKNAVKYATDLMDEKIAMYEEGGYKVPQTVKSPNARKVPPAGAAFGGVNPETGQEEFFDAQGKRIE